MHFHFLLKELNDSVPTAVNDQHTCVVFAQGLKKLGLSYSGNLSFLKNYENDEYLITPTDGPPNPDSIIVCCSPDTFVKELGEYYRQGHKIILFDTRDEWNRAEYDRFIPISYCFFRSSYQVSNMVQNVKPFAFALSDRIIRYAQNNDWNTRKSVILEAHRVTNHSVRNYVKSFYASGKCPIPVEFYNDNFEEPKQSTEEYFHWCQSGRRHSEKYYQKLASVQMLDAHGGYFQQNKIVQIDSWKLWEGFACGCLVIAIDFKYYGIKLPFDLVGFKHYIPIRYDKLEESYTLLARLTDLQRQKIAECGRQFVLDQYSPEGMANYICSAVSSNS